MIPDNLIAIILKGIILSVVGLFVYSTGHRYFKSFDHKFDSKNEAQIVLVGVIFITGLYGDNLLKMVQSVVVGWTGLQQLGIVLIASRLLVNLQVPNWNFNDGFSFLQYIVGLWLFFSPQL